MTDRPLSAAECVDQYFRFYYRRGLDDCEITDTPGYWRSKTFCGGRGKCGSVDFHATMFCEGPVRHTASYRDSSRDRITGRRASPYQTWRELREEAGTLKDKKRSCRITSFTLTGTYPG